MIEQFTPKENAQITWCAEVIHSIEAGKADQKKIDALFHPSYQDVEPLSVMDASMPNQSSRFTRLIQIVQEKYPDMHKSYLPFAIGDLLREAYEANHRKENQND